MTGIIVGFRDPFFEVTEGVNMSINICGFLNSQTGVWKNNLTAIIVAKSGTAKGLAQNAYAYFKL